jgi:hypothetical protein
MTIGERNNNPLNIRYVSGTCWKGSLPLRGGLEGSAFVRFSSLEWGLRAAFCILRTYRDKYKLVCIEDIITRWAPPTENDTRRYICDCCKLTGFGGKERLTENDWPRLVGAMARLESGMNLTEETLNQSYQLYKNEKP